MALPTTATYITEDEFRDYTRVAGQKTLDDDEITPSILYAESIIDSYIGGTDKYDEDQLLKFPIIDSDGNSVIPNDLKFACIDIVSGLILNGEPTKRNEAKRENWSADGYSRELKDNPTSESVSVGLSPYAKRLLKKYCVNIAKATY